MDLKTPWSVEAGTGQILDNTGAIAVDLEYFVEVSYGERVALSKVFCNEVNQSFQSGYKTPEILPEPGGSDG